MNNHLSVMVLYILSIYLLGLCTLYCFFKQIQRWNLFLKLSFSWLLGNCVMLFVAFALFFSNNLASFTTKKLFLLFLFFVLVLLIIHIKNHSILFEKVDIRNLVFLFLLLIFFYPFAENATTSYLVDWDPIALWFLKAKAFFINSEPFSNPILTSHYYSYAHNAYPIGIPLIISLYYHLIDFVNDQIAQLYLFMYFINIIFLTLGIAIKLYVKNYIPWLFFIIVWFFIAPIFVIYAHNGYVDIVLSFFYASVITLFILIIENKKKYTAQTINLAIFVSFLAPLIKSEGLFLLFFTLVFCLYFYIKYRLKLIYLISTSIISMIPFFFWELYKKKHDFILFYNKIYVPPDFVFRIKTIFFYYLDSIMNTSLYTYILFLLVCVLIFEYTYLVFNKKLIYLIPSYILFWVWFLYTIVFATTPVPFYKSLTSSCPRLILQTLPSFFIIAIYHIKIVFNIEHT